MRDRLQQWLGAQLGRRTGIVTLRRIATGHSRAMWFAELDDGQRLVVRIEQGGVFGTSSVAEHELMGAAARLGCPVAPLRWLEPTGSILGQPFFVMDFVDSAAASVPREDRSLTDEVAVDFIRRLHALHQADWRGELAEPAHLMQATHMQIERWSGVYRAAPALSAPLLDEAEAWLHRHAPAMASASIVHGDPGPGNFLHDGSRVMVFTDWEFAHLGDPMEDWVYLISMRGARTMTADRWRQMIRDTVGVHVTDWHLRYWGAFNFFKGACANLTGLEAFAGPNPAPNMAIIGSALQQTFMRAMASLVAG